jgi:pyrroloquinoline quinone (PQQ) biosynthesis protein C
MASGSPFRAALEAAVAARHCADHPMTEKWARGELSHNALMGWAVEHYHWVSNIGTATFYILAKAPAEVRPILLENYLEERDPQRPHHPIVLRFAAANGADVEAVKRGRGLPTTESWVGWRVDVARHEHFAAAIAAGMIGSESQSVRLYSKVLPALREVYRFPEEAIEHFWLHAEADIAHSERGFQILEQVCTTRELQEMAIHFARESARRRWFYFDGIYLHYELGYRLGD